MLLLPLTSTAAQQNSAGQQKTAELKWQRLADGLELGIFPSPQRAEYGDSLIRILRMDPQYFELKLMNTSASKDGRPLTAKQWCRQNGLVAAINASMYQADHKTSVSLMRKRSHVNNPRLSKDKTILAFDRLASNVPKVRIIDRQCEDFNRWKSKYGTLVQSIRMISCKGENVWSQQARKWSTAAIGTDHQGRVLFIHVGSPYSTHDLINILRILPLDINRAMYSEGGPQAQLYIRYGKKEHEFVGQFDLKLNENINSPVFWPIPNVIGISAIK
ncbi:MAG: phosphodiester glycosidase family protein [Deltaproteobacteria bacterium]|nr:phosphodiester glycosidase family protein [Deltaproteobacteria bacterium]